MASAVVADTDTSPADTTSGKSVNETETPYLHGSLHVRLAFGFGVEDVGSRFSGFRARGLGL